jgi:hypothetical protein
MRFATQAIHAGQKADPAIGVTVVSSTRLRPTTRRGIGEPEGDQCSPAPSGSALWVSLPRGVALLRPHGGLA